MCLLSVPRLPTAYMVACVGYPARIVCAATVHLLKEAGTSHRCGIIHNEVGSVIIDALCLVDIEASMLVNEKEKEEVRERLLLFLKESERYLCADTMKERMEIETLGSASIVKNSKKFFQFVIKTKTKLL